MSITSETKTHSHIEELHGKGMKIVFFDRVCEDIDTAKITTDDFESGYKATQHLIDCGCKKIALLSISNSLSISSSRMEGYKKALADNKLKLATSDILLCSNDQAKNQLAIKKMLQKRSRPDGVIATVEKLTTDVYIVCRQLKLSIPADVQVISFSNLPSAPILDPPLTTITQPAFEMGKTASAILFKALDKPNFNIKKESAVIPSSLIVRGSTRPRLL